MAKNSVNDYDQTAGNNTDVASVNIAEGCAPANINNAIRALMAHLAAAFQGGITVTSIKAATLAAGTLTAAMASGTTASYTTVQAAALSATTATVTSIAGTTASYTTIYRNGTALGDASTKNVGTASGTVVMLNGTGMPAVDGSALTGLNASNLATGTVPAARQGSGYAVAGASFQTNGTVNAGLNVSSVTRNNAGDYTINFATDLGTTNYVLLGTVHTGSENDLRAVIVRNRTTTSCRINTVNEGSVTESGVSWIMVMVWVLPAP